jgi:hypothetical protein
MGAPLLASARAENLGNWAFLFSEYAPSSAIKKNVERRKKKKLSACRGESSAAGLQLRVLVSR